MTEQDFVQAGFTVVDSEVSQNKLLNFLKENYPSVIKDNEIDLTELKAVAGLPIDEKTNGYGLNFVGRHFARAKYAQKTQQELRLNRSLSVAEMTTQNLVLKGDNLDSLKLLKSHYSGKIKCIYIDPPYNTTSDEFVYPDKFDREEAEVLGLANLSENDFARMDFSFKSKKSHNGWLAFMYPRLLLARDLLSKDGVIFISIDDNEQANLKLLCDDVFGEENFVANFIRRSINSGKHDSTTASVYHENLLVFSKNIEQIILNRREKSQEERNDLYPLQDEYISTRGRHYISQLDKGSIQYSDSLNYPIIAPDGSSIWAGNGFDDKSKVFRWSKEKVKWGIENNYIVFKKQKDKWKVYAKSYEFRDHNDNEIIPSNPYTTLDFITKDFSNFNATPELQKIFDGKNIFDFPKPVVFIKDILKYATDKNSIILDFFAGSGTTGHAVMQLNAQDGGNRKFILCQIDQPISQDKPAYQFCINNNLPPVISSITIERLKRAGEKIAQEIQEANSKTGLFEEDKKQVPDTGFKVFDSVPAPQLTIDEQGQIVMPSNNIDALSRIYNMMFTVGLDEPTQTPQEVVKDCIYKIGNHYYITNSHSISSDDYVNAIKNGKVFIDGWTASINATLRHYKEDVKIVF